MSTQWTILNPLPEYHWHTSETKELRESLNAEISDHLSARAELDDAYRIANDADVEGVSYAELKSAENLRERRFNLLQAEIALRQKLSGFYSQESRDANARIHDLASKMEETRGEVAKALLQAGYIEPVTGQPVQGAYTQDMINRHPWIVWAHRDVQSVREIAGNRERNPANLDRINEAKKDLGRIRAEMTV
ncbi:MAG: hypothetical protein KDA80_10795 [Planctomycetaceae bacterium]|nr:hypothetical protein [Planctomycetaceae bacterium]